MDILSTTFRSSEKKPEIIYKAVPISSTVIPVEVFVLLLIHSREKFTISSLVKMFQSRHRIELRFERMQQIVEDLVSAGKVAKTKDLGKKNRVVAFYTFNKIA